MSSLCSLLTLKAGKPRQGSLARGGDPTWLEAQAGHLDIAASSYRTSSGSLTGNKQILASSLDGKIRTIETLPTHIDGTSGSES